jgi:hypothetical protein
VFSRLDFNADQGLSPVLMTLQTGVHDLLLLYKHALENTPEHHLFMKASRQSSLVNPKFASRVCLRLGGVVAIAAILVGCGHKTAANSNGPTVTPDDSNPAPAPPSQSVDAASVAPVTVAAAPDGGADLRDLNHAYVGWIIQTHQRAKSFEEYVAASGVSVPPPPAGKKYVIDGNGFIAIQNQ